MPSEDHLYRAAEPMIPYFGAQVGWGTEREGHEPAACPVHGSGPMHGMRGVASNCEGCNSTDRPVVLRGVKVPEHMVAHGGRVEHTPNLRRAVRRTGRETPGLNVYHPAVPE